MPDDKWAKYAMADSGGSKWDQYASTPSAQPIPGAPEGLPPISRGDSRTTPPPVPLPQGITGTPTRMGPRGIQIPQTDVSGQDFRTLGTALSSVASIPGAAVTNAPGIGGAFLRFLGASGAALPGAALGQVGTEKPSATSAGIEAGTTGLLSAVGQPFLRWLASSRSIGAGALQQASQKAGNAVVELSPRTNELVDDLVQQSKLGGKPIKVVSDLLERVGPSTKIPAEAPPNPLTYDEARILQSNMSNLTTEESMGLKGSQKGLLKQLAGSFSKDVQAAADKAGAGEEHAFGMKEYAQAAARNRTLGDAAKYSIPTIGGLGGGYAVLKKLGVIPLLFLVLASGAWGQSLFHYENILLNQNGTPVVGASVFVCAGQANPIFTNNPPCTLQTIYSDPNGAFPITQPTTTSPLGNYGFWVAPGTVTLALTGASISNTSDIIVIPISASGNTNFTGTINCTIFNAVACVSNSNPQGWSGADACAWINSALTSNNIVDARGLTGSVSCAGGIAIGATQSVYLGSVTLTVNGQITLAGSSSHLIGINRATVILQGGSLASNTPIIVIAPSTVAEQTTVENLGINCNNGTNSIGGENINGEEQSGFFNVIVQNCTKYGLWYEGSNAQNSSGRSWVISNTGSGAGSIGAYIHNVSSFRGIRDATFNTNDSGTIGNQLVIDGSAGTYSDLHIEHGTNGIDIGPVTQSVGAVIDNVTGNSNAPTLIKIENVSGNRVQLRNIIGNGSTTILNDALRSITDTNTLIKFYDSNDANFAPYYIAGGQATKLYGPLVSAGTNAVLSGTGACATITTQSGGAWAGTGKCTGTTGASTLTITFVNTAPAGYVCDVWDETNRANVFQQTAHTQNTCVLTITSVTQNDVFVFKAVAF